MIKFFTTFLLGLFPYDEYRIKPILELYLCIYCYVHNTREGLEAYFVAPSMRSRYERWWCCNVIFGLGRKALSFCRYSFCKAVTCLWIGVAEFPYPYGSFVESNDAVIPSCCCCIDVEQMKIMTKLAESPKTANKAVDKLRYHQDVDSLIIFRPALGCCLPYI